MRLDQGELIPLPLKNIFISANRCFFAILISLILFPLQPQAATKPKQSETTAAECLDPDLPGGVSLKNLEKDLLSVDKKRNDTKNGEIICSSNQIHVGDALKIEKSKEGLLQSLISLKISQIIKSSTPLEILKFLSKQLPSDRPCIETADYRDLILLVEAARTNKWDCSISEIYSIFGIIAENRKAWISEATQSQTPVLKEVALKQYPGDKSIAKFRTKPDGSVIISYKDSVIGLGSYKIVRSNYAVDGHAPRIHDLIPLVEVSDIRPGEENGLKKEIEFYRALDNYERTKGESTRRNYLARGDIIELPGGKFSLIQKRFDTDLKKGMAKLTLEDRRNALHQTAQGLSLIHEMGLVHGDVKEGNVMWDAEKKEAVLTDFGLTYNPREKINPRDTITHEAPEMLNMSEIAKTPEEVVRFQKRDVFAFGIFGLNILPSYRGTSSLFEMCKYFVDLENGSYERCIARSAPIFHDKMVAIEKKLCNPTSRQTCLEAIISDCVDPDPDKRPTMAEIEKRLANSIHPKITSIGDERRRSSAAGSANTLGISETMAVWN